MNELADYEEAVAAIIATIRLGSDVWLAYGAATHKRFFLLLDINAVIITNECARQLIGNHNQSLQLSITPTALNRCDELFPRLSGPRRHWMP